MTDLLERVRQRRGELGLGSKSEEEEKVISGWDADLIPDVEPYERSEEDDEIDRVIRGIDIVDAYRRWCGKMEPKVGSKRESIMVSCPVPGHADSNPSAWMNLDKDTGYCAVCDVGFDPIILFGWRAGLDPTTDFPELRRRMAEDMGYVVKRTPGGTEYVEPVEAEGGHAAPVVPLRLAPPSVTTGDDESEEDAEVIDLSIGDGDDYFANVPPIDWRSLLGPDSRFLLPWMEATSADDLPEEFYFWLGLQALGCAIGNNAKLADLHPVRGNLLICLVGPSGQGKSKSIRALTSLLNEAVPYERGTGSTGTKLVNLPGSGEALVDEFSEAIHDPTDPKVIIGYESIRGLVKANELAALTKRAGRQGNTIQTYIMEMYDEDAPISAASRTAGGVKAEGHFGQFVSTTQPKLMRDLLSNADADSGFVNRWIFVVGQPKRRISLGGKPLDLSRCIEPLRDVRSWASGGRSVTVTPEAFDRWDEFFHEEVVGVVESDDAVTSRIDLLLKKLMLLFAADKGERDISPETLEQVLSLWPYLLATYGGVTVQVGSNDAQDCEQNILAAVSRHIEQTGKSPVMRDIQRRLGRKYARYGRRLVAESVKLLIATGELDERSVTATNGRRIVKYALK